MCPAASTRLYAAMNSRRWVHELVLEQKVEAALLKKKMYQRDVYGTKTYCVLLNRAGF